MLCSSISQTYIMCPYSWSQNPRGCPHHSPALTRRVPTVRAMGKAAGLSLSHDAHHKHDFPGFGDPNLFRAILIISSFCQAEKLFSQMIPQSHNNFEILFPVFLLTWFATSIPPPPLSTSATPCFLSFLNSISSSHSPTCSYTSIVLSVAS